jgi:hypothetical protein
MDALVQGRRELAVAIPVGNGKLTAHLHHFSFAIASVEWVELEGCVVHAMDTYRHRAGAGDDGRDHRGVVALAVVGAPPVAHLAVQHRLRDLAVLHAALQLLLLLVVDVELVLQVVDVLLVIVPGNPRAPFDRSFKQT